MFVTVLAKILTTTKMSSLGEPSPRIATVALLFPPQYVLLLLLLHLSLFHLLLLAPLTSMWLDTRRMTSSGSSRLFWIFDLRHLFRLPLLLPLRTMKAHMSGLWKLGSRTFIRIKLTWSVTISSSSAKITLLPLVSQAQTEFRLRLPC